MLILCLFACMDNSKPPTFEKEETSTLEAIPNSPFLGLPVGLVYFQNKLIISDFHLDTLLTVFDLNKNAELRIQGSEGEEAEAN